MIKLLRKRLSIPKIVFEPIKRDIKKDIMFRNEVIAKAWFDFIYSHLVNELLKHDKEKSEMLQQLLIDIKTLSDNNWAKIKF